MPGLIVRCLFLFIQKPNGGRPYLLDTERQPLPSNNDVPTSPTSDKKQQRADAAAARTRKSRENAERQALAEIESTIKNALGDDLKEQYQLYKYIAANKFYLEHYIELEAHDVFDHYKNEFMRASDTDPPSLKMYDGLGYYSAIRENDKTYPALYEIIKERRLKHDKWLADNLDGWTTDAYDLARRRLIQPSPRRVQQVAHSLFNLIPKKLPTIVSASSLNKRRIIHADNGIFDVQEPIPTLLDRESLKEAKQKLLKQSTICIYTDPPPTDDKDLNEFIKGRELALKLWWYNVRTEPDKAGDLIYGQQNRGKSTTATAMQEITQRINISDTKAMRGRGQFNTAEVLATSGLVLFIDEADKESELIVESDLNRLISASGTKHLNEKYEHVQEKVRTANIIFGLAGPMYIDFEAQGIRIRFRYTAFIENEMSKELGAVLNLEKHKTRRKQLLENLIRWLIHNLLTEEEKNELLENTEKLIVMSMEPWKKELTEALHHLPGKEVSKKEVKEIVHEIDESVSEKAISTFIKAHFNVKDTRKKYKGSENRMPVWLDITLKNEES